MKKKEKYFGFGMIALALVFLFNPNITVIDLLPDWIGYWLLCVSLARVADLQETVGAAVTAFRRMIFVDAAKILALLWIFGMSAPSERTASILLWTFVFGVLELIFLLPAYGKLFEGLTQLGYLYPNESLLENGKGRRSRTERIRNLTWLFIVAKSVLPILPELADLTNLAYDETSGLVNLYRYIGLMRAMAFLPVLVIGFVWLIRIQLYFARLRRDEMLLDFLRAAYEERVAPKVGLFARRDLGLSYLLLILSLGLTLDLRLDGQNVLPDFLAAVLFLILFAVLARQTCHRGRILCVLPYFLTSFVASVVEYRFFERFSYGQLIKSEDAMHAYNWLFACNALKALAFVAVIVFLLLEFRTVIRKHTGYVLGREYQTEAEEKMVRALWRELDRSFLLAGIATGGYLLSDVLYDVLIPDLDFFVFIPTLLGLVAVGAFVRAMSALTQAMDAKYMLE